MIRNNRLTRIIIVCVSIFIFSLVNTNQALSATLNSTQTKYSGIKNTLGGANVNETYLKKFSNMYNISINTKKSVLINSMVKQSYKLYSNLPSEYINICLDINTNIIKNKGYIDDTTMQKVDAFISWEKENKDSLDKDIQPLLNYFVSGLETADDVIKTYLTKGTKAKGFTNYWNVIQVAFFISEYEKGNNLYEGNEDLL